MRRIAVTCAVVLVAVFIGLAAKQPQQDPRLHKASRAPDQNGWIFVHLEGSPADIGYQHGFLLAREIEDARKAIEISLTHDAKPWAFFRDAAEHVLWPKLPNEYQAEIQGIAEGARARAVKIDSVDLTVMNAWLELSPYYLNWYEKSQKHPTGDHCSAFVATGSYTKDGRPVIAHNNWTDYLTGSRWNIIFDVKPSSGHAFIMDGMPGLIHSGDDFGLNSAGIMITETTISEFHGFDPTGVAEFARARRAMQYASTIDDFARLMQEGNNGGYANDWLVADRNTGEVASLELGLKNVNLKRTKDGYFVGSNYPIDPKLTAEETNYDLSNKSLSANARHIRWDAIMAQYKGKIDLALAQKFLGDHYDTFDNKEQASERTLCGHIELSARGSKPWQPEFAPAGAVQAKATTAVLSESMQMTAALGHPCGIHFKAAKHLSAHPEFAWQKPSLRDLDSHPWTGFKAK